jgi:ATP-binding cassette subfamily F protein uup
VTDVLVVDGEGFAGRWPGGYAAWDAARRSGAVGPARAKGGGGRRGDTRDKAGDGRSASTLGHLLRELEKRMARLERRREQLTVELAGAGSDHQALARAGGELAEVEAELVEAEEQWLELAEEREASSGRA